MFIGPQGERDPVGKVRILARFPGSGLQLFAPRLGAFGDAGQGVGKGLALMLDVEDVAVAGLVAPGGLLSGAQPLARIGDRAVGIQTLQRSVEQMNSPGVGIAMFDCGKQIAVGQPGVDTGEHGLGTLEDFVVQADTNWRQIYAAIDRAGRLHRSLMDVVDGSLADGHA